MFDVDEQTDAVSFNMSRNTNEQCYY